MDSDQARQFALFGWIMFIFLAYPSIFGWITWKIIQMTGAPMELMVLGIAFGLFLATYHLLIRVKKEQKTGKK